MLTHQWLDGRNPRMQEKGMLARHSFFMLLIVGVHCGKRACDKNDTKHRQQDRYPCVLQRLVLQSYRGGGSVGEKSLLSGTDNPVSAAPGSNRYDSVLYQKSAAHARANFTFIVI